MASWRGGVEGKNDQDALYASINIQGIKYDPKPKNKKTSIFHGLIIL